MTRLSSVALVISSMSLAASGGYGMCQYEQPDDMIGGSLTGEATFFVDFLTFIDQVDMR